MNKNKCEVEREAYEKAFGEFIKYVRCKRKLSQTDLAGMIGVSQAHISRFEKCGSKGRHIDLFTAYKICKVLNTNIYEFEKEFIKNDFL